uniref:Uncharacterized protein n=1 Tax=viral metagenome TaxID=1070528 RepID=A0A6M3LUN9_9ZZZZ
MLLFLCGMAASAVVFAGMIAFSVISDNRRKVRLAKQARVGREIDNLETGVVLLNKRADCALMYTDKVMETHEEVFHKPKPDKKK